MIPFQVQLHSEQTQLINAKEKRDKPEQQNITRYSVG